MEVSEVGLDHMARTEWEIWDTEGWGMGLIRAMVVTAIMVNMDPVETQKTGKCEKLIKISFIQSRKDIATRTRKVLLKESH